MQRQADAAPWWTCQQHHLSYASHKAQADKSFLPKNKIGGKKVLFCNLSQKGGNMLGHEHIKIISRKSGPESYQMSQTEARVHPHLVPIKMKIPGAEVTTAPMTVI